MRRIAPNQPSPLTKTAVKQNPVQRYAPKLYALWQFSRPHTIVGTSLSVLALYLIALSLGNGQLPTLLGMGWRSLLGAWFACLCGNVYIVGLNQLEDVDIDRVNKPHLPLASGEFSRREGQMIVAVTGVLAVVLAIAQGQFLALTVISSLLIGTAYSLPPIRLKRFPFWASLCIFTVRGVIVNLGLFLHFSPLTQAIPTIPPSVWALTGFILVFTFAIAIFKDIPDLEGDRRYNIHTLTLRLGQRTVFNLARWVITSCYLGMAIAAVLIPNVNASLIIVSHLGLLLLFWLLSLRVNLKEKAAIAQFYQFIWKLFFLEYLIFPVACLLQ